jgi:FtsP/CotA-like multicopper oxidase with cupredoxin domain
VAPGDIIVVALKADNPGLWMDHCHNLEHASSGMVMHLMYQNVTSPFEVGPATRNNPE